MTAAFSNAPLRPGDPPPFWEGLWHPEGKAEGAIKVTPRMGQAPSPKAPEMLQAPSATAQRVIPMAQETSLSKSEASGPAPSPGAPSPEPLQAPISQAPAPVSSIPSSAPQAAPASQAPRSYVLSLIAQGPLSPVSAMPAAPDAPGAAEWLLKAKAFQTAGQLGPSLQALAESLKRQPGEAAVYAQLGSVLLAGRAWEDAAHHFLLAYMLAPKAQATARMTLHTVWALGYVGWAFQIAQSLYKIQPAADLAEIGKQAMGWLSHRDAAFTSLCPACRQTAITAEALPCARCQATPLGAPCNAVGFNGLKLLHQSQSNRLFVGAACNHCRQDTPLLIGKGGPACQGCGAIALAPLAQTS